jgi:hypothetical protein
MVTAAAGMVLASLVIRDRYEGFGGAQTGETAAAAEKPLVEQAASCG